ncbi:acyltransferase family protein [Trujillonella humicola]|uniref:acyltransferase family protein n=1 Tax=Trujillonella humicola TaxID=3383699 RepID=UPI003905DE8E
MRPAVVPRPESARSPVAAPARRTEVDGLRALAVALVVGYHVFTGRVSGGVDVFLALSGFFLVHSLAGQHRRTGRIRVLPQIARTTSRLVPPALLVIASTGVVSAFLLPEGRWRELAWHLLASATFTENHRLVHEAVDYSASNAIASPLQQFWSLSIQMQVLLIAPVVVVAGAWLLRRLGVRRVSRQAVVAAVAAVTGASLAWSLLATAENQPVAYFSTLPRVWEFGVGALVALLLAAVRPRPGIGLALGWGGLLALVAFGGLVDGAHRLPGWEALWPVSCAMAIVVAADTGGRWGVHRVLGLPAVRWLGVRSYALYLWHWPVLVLYLVHYQRDEPSLRGAAAVIGLSVVLAALAHRLVERPVGVRLPGRRPAVALAVVAAGVLPAAGAGVAALEWLDRQAERTAAAADDPAYPGAAALGGALVSTGGVSGVEPLPAFTVIRDDWPELTGAECWTEEEPAEPVPAVMDVCRLGPDDASRRIVVAGDSHTAQWLTPLAAIAERRSWQVISIVRGGCNLSVESEFLREGEPGYEECVAWRSRLVDRIVGLEPDLVLAGATRTDPDPAGPEFLPTGFLPAWQQLSDAGVRVLALRDTPRLLMDMPDCLARAGDTSPECGVTRAGAYRDELLDEMAEFLPPQVEVVDTSHYFCTDEFCPGLVGNVRVYMDAGHVTATYMRTVRPLLEADLLARTGW